MSCNARTVLVILGAGLILLLVFALLTGVGMGGMGQMMGGTTGLVFMFIAAALLVPAIFLTIVLIFFTRR